MTMQESVAARNAKLDAAWTVIGASPRLQLFTGAPPANCAAAATGTQLVNTVLPATPMNAAASGQKTINGPWPFTGIAGGVAGYFRILDNAGTTCHRQGTVGTSGADMIVDNTNIANGQNGNVTQFTITGGNA